jgi:hypothetical protein
VNILKPILSFDHDIKLSFYVVSMLTCVVSFGIICKVYDRKIKLKLLLSDVCCGLHS